MTTIEAKEAISKFYESLARVPDLVDVEEHAEPVKMKGNWIDLGFDEEWYGKYYECKFCHDYMVGASDYCPWCGKPMFNE